MKTPELSGALLGVKVSQTQAQLNCQKSRCIALRRHEARRSVDHAGHVRRFSRLKKELLGMPADTFAPLLAHREVQVAVRTLKKEKQARLSAEKALCEIRNDRNSAAAELAKTTQKMELLQSLRDQKARRRDLELSSRELEETHETSIIAARNLEASKDKQIAGAGTAAADPAIALPVVTAGAQTWNANNHRVFRGIEPPQAGFESAVCHTAVPESFRSQIESIQSWRGLSERGVQLVYTGTEGCKAFVLIRQSGDKQINVFITPEWERDRRMLWLEKGRILGALEKAGLSIGRVVIRRGL